MNEASTSVTLPHAAVAVLIALALASGALLSISSGDYPELHTVLDTAIALLSGVLALLLWDMGEHAEAPLLKLFAISFATASLLEAVHFLVTIEWSGALAPIAAARSFLRPSTWPPPAHLLSIGLIAAFWLARYRSPNITVFALAMAGLGAALFAAYQRLPTYLPPGPLGITRPALIGAPLLWAIAAAMAWRHRRLDRICTPLAWMAAILVLAAIAMLYSRAPADGPAMVAHLGKISGYLVLLICVMQFASRDVRDRISAETRLRQLNAELDHRVTARTAELASANTALEQEMSTSRQAEEKAHAQAERLFLLHQITRAIGERQDLHSIFQVVVRAVETQLPADFACLCLHDDVDHSLTVETVGANSWELAFELAMRERARVEIDENGLSRCVGGQLVYEPDIATLDFPFPKRLAAGGLRSLVIAPLQVENRVFGVLVVARFRANAFVSGECEFLRQLSEHAALAAHQAQIYAALQQAYDDLRQSQQAVMLQDRLRALGQMASGIAHDINNALTPVALYTEAMLETETGLSDSGRANLEIVRRAVTDVAHTIERMREFYRQREEQLASMPVDLNELVQQILDLTKARWSDMALQRGVVIRTELELDADLPAILGIASEIREALINLVLNSVDAMEADGVLTLRTRFTAGANGGAGTADVEIVDNGIGMDAGTQQRCLEPFFTTKGERGTGLGLAMVYGMAQRHGAETSIVSAEGEGTLVRLSFPAHPKVAAEEGDEGSAPLPATRLYVLLVDDDPVLLKALGDTLEREGHHISLANDGQSGIDIFRTALNEGEAFDVVITDLGMPYVDGRKVASDIKALSPTTPIILLTGWGQGLSADVDPPRHVDQILSKPPKLREIREALALHAHNAGRGGYD